MVQAQLQVSALVTLGIRSMAQASAACIHAGRPTPTFASPTIAATRSWVSPS